MIRFFFFLHNRGTSEDSDSRQTVFNANSDEGSRELWGNVIGDGSVTDGSRLRAGQARLVHSDSSWPLCLAFLLASYEPGTLWNKSHVTNLFKQIRLSNSQFLKRPL